MKRVHWVWVLVVLALVADGALFASALPLSKAFPAFVLVLLIHALLSAVLASCTFVLLPRRYRRSAVWSWLLMFDFAFIAPVLGPIGMLGIIHLTLNRASDQRERATPINLELPEYDVRSKGAGRAGQGAIRSRLTSKAPADVRMQSLLTLQVVPNRVANPILEDLLGDATDDVRLIAFGMLDSAEKKLSVQIRSEQKNLERVLTNRARYDCLHHLAELHWELIYAALVQGELRRHVLGEARQSLEAALALNEPQEGGIFFLKGKICLAQGDIEPAELALTEAMRLGQPQASVLPYLAELAFRRRDFPLVKHYMQRLMRLHVASRTMAIVDLWTGRESVHQFRDRRILHHI